MKNNKKNMSKSKKVAVSATLGAVAVGAYYLLGPNSKAHQRKAVNLMSKIKREVTSEFKKAKNAGVPTYNKAVDLISKNYAKQYKIYGKDIKAIAAKLKNEWKNTTGQETGKRKKKI